MKQIIVLYHSGCSDGFGAAWAAWKKLGDKADYIPLRHQTKPDSAWKNKDIYMLDITFFGKELEWLLKNCKSVTTLDHHAQALPAIKQATTYRFDNKKSGATLAWIFFHSTRPVPQMLKHIEDIDLWRFTIPQTREVMAALDNIPMEFDAWSRFASALTKTSSRKKIHTEGALLLSYQNTLARQLAEKAETAIFCGHRAGVVNSPILGSEIGYELYHTFRFPIGIIWSKRSGYYSISLRSKRINVAKLAKRYGGGGHIHAAGIKLPGNAKLPWKYKK